MKVIRLDASGWRSPDDFYSALLPELGAPDWHGRNLDALQDSLDGGINQVEPPFVIQIVGAESLSPEMRSFLADAVAVVDDVRNGTNAEIGLKLA